ncbi:hypothetical protein FJZ31_12460 [Candidatus Poribacteria bacterium]|nr:hypothetical protein [Candidatus Poribacteria bacterium]
MAELVTEEILKDPFVASVALSLSVANEKAQEYGMDLTKYLISITQETTAEKVLWRIHYGPKDYIHRRGGDLVIYVSQEDGMIQKVLRGQ